MSQNYVLGHEIQLIENNFQPFIATFSWSLETNHRGICTGYIQTELMTCFSAENVKIQHFSKKTLNSHVHVSVENDTMKIQKEI